MNLALSVPRPAQAALLPGVVRTPLELTAANVVSSWMENASVLLAPALTGVLLGVGGPALAAGALAACTLAGALLVIGVPGPRPMAEHGEGVSLTAEVALSVAAVWRVPAVRTLVGVVGAQYLLVGALDVLYVVLAITTLGMGESGAGYLNAAFGAGGVVGVAVTAALVARRRLAPALSPASSRRRSPSACSASSRRWRAPSRCSRSPGSPARCSTSPGASSCSARRRPTCSARCSPCSSR